MSPHTGRIAKGDSMPDFDRLHQLSRQLAQLTAPGAQEPGLASWCVMVGETWKEIAEMWQSPEPPAATPPNFGQHWMLEQHRFAPTTGPDKLCGFCGGGKDHPIHQGGTHER
jgi:hypothetical protein